jgi:PDZ domain-containing protein
MVATNANVVARPVIRNVDTQSQTLPPPSGPPIPPPDINQRSRRRRRWPYVLVAALVLFFAVATPVSIGVYRNLRDRVETVDYYVLTPGDATPTEDHIDGKGVTLYPAKGEVLYTTVGVHRMTKAEYKKYKAGTFNKLDDVLTAAQYLGTNSSSQERQEGVQEMSDAKKSALYVALMKLGYKVGLTDAGALVEAIEPDVPAAKILKPNDVIVALDSKPVQTGDDVRALLQGKTPGTVVNLTVKPAAGGDAVTEAITLAKRDDGTGFIGVSLGLPSTTEFQFPVQLDIDTGDVGGPSAGLAFTLAILDVLTPGELTNGKKVAVTGTIDVNGLVGPIGGIKQKAVAAQREGATVFLVPSSEAADAKTASDPKKIQIIGVDTIDDALNALAQIGGNALKLGTPGAGH